MMKPAKTGDLGDRWLGGWDRGIGRVGAVGCGLGLWVGMGS